MSSVISDSRQQLKLHGNAVFTGKTISLYSTVIVY